MTGTGEEASGRFGGLLAWGAARPRRVLALVCLILWAPGVFSLPPLDRDESRFAQASKQMLETGDLVDIRLGHVPRYKKPAGIYWLQAATTAVAGFGDRGAIWTYRLPSLIGGIVAVWLTFWCAGAFLRREVALLSAGLFGATLLMTGEASIATTDAVLTAAILGAQAVLLRVWLAGKGAASAPSWPVVLAGWACIGVAALVKGPPIFIPFLTAALLCLWDRDWRWLKGTKPLIGIPLLIAMIAPWVIAITLKTHGQFFQQSLGQDFATKLQGGQEGHGALPGYFLVALTPCFWPAILFLLPGLAQAIRTRHDPAMRFLLIWAAIWVVFELVPTKLPHYVLPLYPALAIIAALWASWPKDAGTLLDRVLFTIAPVQFALIAVVLAAALVVLPAYYGNGPAWWALAPALVFAALAIAVLWAYFQRRMLAAAVLAILAPLIAYPVLTAGVGPQLSQIWVSPRLAAAIAPLKRDGDLAPALAGYIEPSTLFLFGTDTVHTDGRGAADTGAAQGGLALVEERELLAFKARLAELEVSATELDHVDGLNAQNGHKVHIRIFRVAPVTETPPPPAE